MTTNGKVAPVVRREVPYNIEAEESLLGAALLSATALEVLVHEVEPEDFYRPTYGHIASTCGRLWRAGLNSVDPVLVADELERDGLLEQVGGVAGLLTLQAKTPATSNAKRYARIVVERSILRRLIGISGEIADLAYACPDDVQETIDQARTMLLEVDMPVGAVAPSPDVATFMQTEIVYDWVVPGLIERSDRTILTGGEGAGKSTLLRQMAVAIASGMHPFEYHPFDMTEGGLPSVTIIDVENSLNQIRRKIRPLLEIDGVRRGLDPTHLRIEAKGDGIDLTTRHDTRWLVERIVANKPDLVVIGPIYKLHEGDPNDQQQARKVASVLDMIRIRYRCALLIEAHSPHGENDRNRELRPLGSQLWRAWPEFGYGIARDRQDEDAVWFRPWRGARDEREWPGRLVRSEPWPWGTGRDVGRPVHHDDAGQYEPAEDF